MNPNMFDRVGETLLALGILIAVIALAVGIGIGALIGWLT